MSRGIQMQAKLEQSGTGPDVSKKNITSKRAVEQQLEQAPKVIICHRDRNTHTIHGAAAKDFRS